MKSLKILKTQKITEKSGKIFVFQKSKQINFNFKRVFIVKSNKSQIRGKHAHKKCIQLLNCVSGAVEVSCETAKGNKYKFLLDKPDKFLVIPKMVWCVQKYKKNNTVLAVICSDKFDEKDYIRKYKLFKK
jgi:dTDP-4-dehydrorhamnose 3,5-epimerase-like enzyme